ncbi:MAG: hypothetical protein H6937_09475 [Burkholderiales bacterium]|nr:hypothetical protein [Burkholderiales bacterium]
MTAYAYDMFGWYVGTTNVGSRRFSTKVAPTNTNLLQSEGVLRSNWNGNTWVELPYKYQDPPIVIEAQAKGINPIEFKMLFTSDERVAIYNLKNSNDKVADFLSLLDDIRLTEVRLNIQATIEGTTYAINAIKDAPNNNINYDQAEADNRIAEILAGMQPGG